MSIIDRLTRGQAQGLVEHYRTLLNHLGDGRATQRELAQTRRELKALGYRVVVETDGSVYLKEISQRSKPHE